MKKLLLPLALMIASSVPAQEKDADSMLRKIFSVVQANDEKAFFQLFPDRVSMIELMQHFMPGRSGLADSIMREEMGLNSDASYRERASKEFLQTLHKIREQAEQYQIHWEKVRLADIEYVVLEPAEDRPKILKGSFCFTQATDTFYLDFNDVVWSPVHQVWFGVNFRRLRDKNEPAYEVVQPVADSVVVTEIIMEEEVPPPPPPPPTKKPVDKKTPPARKPKG